jgi:Entner-Doudoroff aldolase
MDVIKELSLIGLVPVIKIDDAKDAAPLAKALYEGGLPCAEVTFRTAAAAEAIAEMVKACPDMLVGAGTVLTTAQVDEAVAAGAKFIVSPGLNPTVVKYCVDKDIPVMPGINNPSGIEQALELGLKVVYFFTFRGEMINSEFVRVPDRTFFPVAFCAHFRKTFSERFNVVVCRGRKRGSRRQNHQQYRFHFFLPF